MAYDGWLEYGGVELVNLSRTAQLSEALGIDIVWVNPSSVAWIQTALGGTDYDVPTNAPWYDENAPESAEFAGIVPLGFPGLDDSSAEATTTEYITAGGRSGRLRNATLPIVASVALVGTSDRGVEFGKRWMDKVLSNRNSQTFCAGVDLRYFRAANAESPVAHRRNVRLTRGSSITRKRYGDCNATWLATFTLTCDDPFEYGEQISVLEDLGGDPTGDVITSGSLGLTQESCPVYDYTPIYDPLYPALVPSPTAPELLPAGWTIAEGDTFTRFWARVTTPEPSTLPVVPHITLTSDEEARMVRVSIWDSTSTTDDQCDPLFSVVVSYLPPDLNFFIDGEQEASYVWDGFSPAVRRTDSLVYNPDAKPVEWVSFNDPDSLLVTLDVFSEGSGSEGGGTVRAALSLVPKSD